MGSKSRFILIFSFLLIFVLFQWPGSVDPGKLIQEVSKVKPEGEKLVLGVNFGKIPLYFIHNKGQVDKKALFYAKTPGYTLWVTKEGLVFDSTKHESKTDFKFSIQNSKLKPENNSKFKIENSKLSHRDVSRLLFIGANKNPDVISLDPQKLKVNYFKGNDKSKWVEDTYNYQRDGIFGVSKSEDAQITKLMDKELQKVFNKL